uniref:SH3 domain-containing protein n=1 Tax=Anopheles minimus TaxID=112268 RepID=A0A182WLT1_9DIPT
MTMPEATAMSFVVTSLNIPNTIRHHEDASHGISSRSLPDIFEGGTSPKGNGLKMGEHTSHLNHQKSHHTSVQSSVEQFKPMFAILLEPRKLDLCKLLAKATFDNIAESTDELAFRKGETLTVIETDTNGLKGWWLCQLRGRQRRVSMAPQTWRGVMEIPPSVPESPAPEHKQASEPNDVGVLFG